MNQEDFIRMEREACAKLCDYLDDQRWEEYGEHRSGYSVNIRARSNTRIEDAPKPLDNSYDYIKADFALRLAAAAARVKARNTKKTE